MSKKRAAEKAEDTWADKPKKINDLAEWIHPVLHRTQREIDAIRLKTVGDIIKIFDIMTKAYEVDMGRRGQLDKYDQPVQYDLMSFLLVKEQQVDVQRKLIERIEALDKLVGVRKPEMSIDTRITRLERKMGVDPPLLEERGYNANPNLWSSRLTVLEEYIQRLIALEIELGISGGGDIYVRLQALYNEALGDYEESKDRLKTLYEKMGFKFPSTNFRERLIILENAQWGSSNMDNGMWAGLRRDLRDVAKKRQEAQQKEVAKQQQKKQKKFEHRPGFFEEEDGEGGEYRSTILWTIIENILSSDSFAYFDDKKQKQNVFYKDDGSGKRDTYIQAFMHWATKDDTWSADAMSLCHIGEKRLNHQHVVRAVLSKFAHKRIDRDGHVYFTAFKKGKLIEFDYQRYYCTSPDECRLLEDGEHIINGINVDDYEQDKLQEIAKAYALNINEVKNVLILLLIMEHELVHTMLAYLDRENDWGQYVYISALNGYPPGYTEDYWVGINKKDTHRAKHDENHGVWFYYFIRNLFNHSGITSALENATCDSASTKITANTRDVLKDFDIKLRF